MIIYAKSVGGKASMAQTRTVVIMWETYIGHSICKNTGIITGT
jgi:hypothetical protein